MEKYAGVMKQFPEKVWQQTDKYLHNSIALLKPQTYIAGFKLFCYDYSIVITPTPPPDSYINNRLISFSSGEVVIFNPGDTMLCCKAQLTKQYFSLMLQPELMNRIAEEIGISGELHFEKLKNPFSSEVMQLILAFDKETKRTDCINLMIESMSIQIAATILRTYKSNMKKYTEFTSDNSPCINIAIEFMQAFYGANISIEDICKEINISPFHFIRTFNKKLGISPYQYLINIRIKKAEELLNTGQYTVAEVATLCGFINLSHFSSTFKKSTGHAPSRYSKAYY